MTSERDPALQALFDTARAEFDRGQFEADVMARIERDRRRSITSWIALLAAFAVVAWLFVPGVVTAINLVSQLLPQSLVDLDTAGSFFGPILAPLNSVATMIALGLLGVWLLYRKVF